VSKVAKIRELRRRERERVNTKAGKTRKRHKVRYTRKMECSGKGEEE